MSENQGSAKILIIDIERVRGKALIPFWDLSEYKYKRIQPRDVTRWPTTICFAYRWYGEEAIGFHADWTESSHEQMLLRAWKLYDEADIVVGHNTESFDSKKFKAEWAVADLLPPSPWKSFDTLKVARREFGFESNTLDALCTRLGIPGKVDKYDPDRAEAALTGDAEAQTLMQKYNEGDVEASTALYEYLRPWASHPNIGLFVSSEAPICPNCGSENLQKRGTAISSTSVFTRYQCQECGRWSRGKKATQGTEMRSI